MRIRKFILILFLLTIAIYTLIVVENKFIKISVISIITLIVINLYFYKELVRNFRKTHIDIINFSLYVISLNLLVFSHKDINKVLIKLIDIKNNISFDNTYYYMLVVSIIFLTILTIINFFKDFNKIGINKKEDDTSLLSFRKKEKESLIEKIEDKQITSILIEAEMGNGKTTLINSLINDLTFNNECEIIYFKLPLLKSYEELEKTVLKELQKIFIKYDLNNQFIYNFLNNISTFKIGCFELNFGKKENLWETIKKLQETLKKLDKKILIILDDIEREEDYSKIYKSILFLGELSEYFKGTKTTILFLTQYDYLEKIFLEHLNDVNNTESKEKEKEFRYLEKYYKYRFKLTEPKINKLIKEDFEIIIKEGFKNICFLSKEENELEISKFLEEVIKDVNEYFQYKNTPKIFNIRKFERVIKKISYLFYFYKESYFTYIVFLFCILEENYGNLETAYDFIPGLEATLEKRCSIYVNHHIIPKSDIKLLIEDYIAGDIINENLEVNARKIEKIINGNIELKKDEFDTINTLGYFNYILNLIDGNKEKAIRALKANLITSKHELVNIIIKIPDILEEKEIIYSAIKKIFLEKKIQVEKTKKIDSIKIIDELREQQEERENERVKIIENFINLIKDLVSKEELEKIKEVLKMDY